MSVATVRPVLPREREQAEKPAPKLDRLALLYEGILTATVRVQTARQQVQEEGRPNGGGDQPGRQLDRRHQRPADQVGADQHRCARQPCDRERPLVDRPDQPPGDVRRHQRHEADRPRHRHARPGQGDDHYTERSIRLPQPSLRTSRAPRGLKSAGMGRPLPKLSAACDRRRIGLI